MAIWCGYAPQFWSGGSSRILGFLRMGFCEWVASWLKFWWMDFWLHVRVWVLIAAMVVVSGRSIDLGGDFKGQLVCDR